MRRIRTIDSHELSAAERSTLTRLCAAAFHEPWEDAWWEGLGPATHVVAAADGSVVAHACFIERELRVAGRPLRTAYVEAVATHPQHQGEGHGMAVMQRIGELIRAGGHELGALSTGSHGFYARQGWERWQGPTFIRMADGELQRSAEEDDGVMILRTSATPLDLDLSAPISVPWRPGEPW